jgi:glycosyltransferase 2 family protein
VSARKFRLLILSTLLAVVLYLVVVFTSDLDAIRSILSRLEMWELGLIFGLSLLNYGLRFVRWHWYARTLGHVVPIRANLIFYLAGFAFTMTPGKAGEVIRSLYLKSHGVGYSDSLALFFTERLLDVMAMIFLAGLAIFQFKNFGELIIGCGASIMLMVRILRHALFQGWLQGVSYRIAPARLRPVVNHLFSLLSSSAALLQTPIFFGGLLLGLLAWGAEGITLHYILTFIGLESSASVAIGIYAISILAGALSFIPGGLGGTEAIMGLLLMRAGADPTGAVAATLLCRIATLWFAVFIGILAMAGLEARKWFTTEIIQ